MTESVVHVIDDDEAMRQSLAFLLDTAGLSPLTYESAPQFLEALDSAPAGVIVTDIRMPEMTGLELVRRLKAKGAPHPAYRNLRVVPQHNANQRSWPGWGEGGFPYHGTNATR